MRTVLHTRLSVHLVAWSCLAAGPAFLGEAGTAPRQGQTARPTAVRGALEHATVNGVRLAYRVAGGGVPVIFVHGESHSHEVWNEQVEPVSRRFAAVTYDRRGHGESEAPATGYSALAHMHDLSALMQHLGMPNAHFVVSSRGGAIVLQLLRVNPEAVRSVVFADATIPLVPLSPGFEAAVERYRRPAPSIEEAKREREARKQAPFYKVARSMPKVADVLSRMIDAHSLRNALNPRRGADLTSPMDIGPWNDRDFPDMSSLAKPVLIVVGAESDAFFLRGAEAAAADWPGVRHVVMRGVDHLLPLEAPDEFNKLLLEFLSQAEEGERPASNGTARAGARPAATPAGGAAGEL